MRELCRACCKGGGAGRINIHIAEQKLKIFQAPDLEGPALYKVFNLEVEQNMIRRDVFKLAEKLRTETGFPVWQLYDWLMDVGRAKNTNPTRLNFITGHKIVFVRGDRDGCCMEQYNAPHKWEPEYTGPDYENMILARQEKWID